MPAENAQSVEKQSFQAEVGRLLQIVANSLYSDRDIFLRELISNASDACDKMRYEAQVNAAAGEVDLDYRVVLNADAKAGILSISDNGIGMSKQELVNNLGTIAKSGTAAFVAQLEGQDGEKPASSLIGQFGVGFYSAFMVADLVTVESRRAGAAESWRWESDGLGEFSVSPGERPQRGTTIRLKLKKDAKDYLETATLKRIVREHSNHVGVPVVLAGESAEETLNEASALWLQPKGEITEAQYADFYHHVSNNFDDPAVTIHARVEGKIEYALLLFIPTTQPFDLFDPVRRHHVRLYVRRVFVGQEVEGLVPAYLRFLCGVVDSEDLDLNVSREMLQDTPLIAKIRKDIVKRVFRELKRLADKEADKFAAFWKEFGAVVKEGLYEDPDVRGDILEIARFRSTGAEDATTLADYVGRMKEGQDAIYYLVGDEGSIERSPQLEGYKARGVEVLLLSDPVDDFWINAVGDYEGKAFKSVTRGASDLDSIARTDAKEDETAKGDDDAVARLVGYLKISLKDRVKDVRTSTRLTDSAACLVVDEGGIDMHTERLLRQHGRIKEGSPRVLEINPQHKAITSLAGLAAREAGSTRLEDAANVLLDQAMIMEGEMPSDVAAYARRIAALLSQAAGSDA